MTRMSATGVEVPKHGLNPTLRIPRDALVQKVIDIAEGSDKHVYIRGAAGTGKTVLLELIAVHLQSVGKRAVYIRNALKLEECMEDIREILRDRKPLYVLVDEAHMVPANNDVWGYLKEPQSTFITIAAGIPDDSRASSMFSNHIEVKEMFLTSAELTAVDVVAFFTNRLSESLEANEIQVEQSECEATVKKVLAFAHMFTNGHSFPCLKLAEFFLTVECRRCCDAHVASDGMEVSLTQALCLPAFEAVYMKIYNRCYHEISRVTFGRLISAWW